MSIIDRLQKLSRENSDLRYSFERSACWESIKNHIKKSPEKSVFASEDDVNMLDADCKPTSVVIDRIEQRGVDHVEVNFAIYWEEDGTSSEFPRGHSLRIPASLVDNFSEEAFKLWLAEHRKIQERHFLKRIQHTISLYLKGSASTEEEFLSKIDGMIKERIESLI